VVLPVCAASIVLGSPSQHDPCSRVLDKELYEVGTLTMRVDPAGLEGMGLPQKETPVRSSLDRATSACTELEGSDLWC
jgi:hypothetical protein